MLLRLRGLRALPWNDFLAGMVLGESSVLVAIYIWYTFFRG